MGSQLVAISTLSRRAFLGTVAIGAAATAIPLSASSARAETLAPFVIRRREDLLRLTIRPVGVTVDLASGRITPTGDRGLLIVSFGPQSVVERAYDPTATPVAPVPARLAGDSQISFIIESSVSMTLSSLLSWAGRDQFLSDIGWYLDGEILPSSISLGKNPNRDVTQIEMPWWLVLSPHRWSAWTQQVSPKTSNGRSEIFHTRLASALGDDGLSEDPTYRTVRGIWIRDPSATSMLSDPSVQVREGSTGHPWSMVPTPRDRADIVRLTGRTGANQVGGRARAIKARLALTPLGGQLVAEGAWDEEGVSSMTAWQQRIWQGRDTYAKVVRRGFLYPWGFKAAQITEGVRVFRADSRGAIRAVWEKRVTIAVTEPTIDLDGTGTATDAGRRAALFSEVTCLTTQTPPLVIPSNPPSPGAQWRGLRVYTPKVAAGSGSTAFPFDLVGIDPDGREVPFTQPLLFAEQKVATARARRGEDGVFSAADRSDPNFTEEGAEQLRQFYDTAVAKADKAADFAGGAISYAQNLINSVISDGGEELSEGLMSRATSISTQDIIFGLRNVIPGVAEADDLRLMVQATVDELLDEFHPNNFPIIQEAQVYLEDTARLVGETVTAALNYPLEYLSDAFDEAVNKGQVFLQRAEDAANEFIMDAAKAGGVIAPNLDVAGISRTLGNVYGKAEALRGMLSDGRITPGEAFAAIKLLGGVTLADIMPNPYPGVDAEGRPTGVALSMATEFVDTGLDSERAVVTMSMDVDAQGPDGADILTSIPLITVDRARLSLNLRSEVPTVSGEATWSVRGQFSDFILHLVDHPGLEFVDVDVARIIFTAGSGQSPSVDVDVRAIDFSGLLTLVKSLASYLPFGDQLVIDVDSSGLEASFFIELPTIALGAVAVSGVGVGAALAVPFTSGPVRFGFLMSYPEDPFSLTITGLGGGGWLEQAMGLQGIESLSIAGFLAADAQVDFGVASGGVAVRAGFQFAIGPPDPAVNGVDDALKLTAFASLNGHLEVLGIASASIDVYVGLSVIVPSNLPDYAKLHGIATCTLRVSVAFFSESVTFDVERTIKMAYIDPPELPDLPRSASRSSRQIEPATFADAWTSSSWADFCGAFA